MGNIQGALDYDAHRLRLANRVGVVKNAKTAGGM
jgi:hypothetical protein